MKHETHTVELNAKDIQQLIAKEFDEEQANLDEYIIAPGQEYRVNDPRYSKNVKYIWMTIPDGSNIKIYKQKRKVAYADYRSGMFYISPHECVIQN